MEKTFEEILDEGIYRAMLTERPTLVAAVADLVAQGQAPAAIAQHLCQRYGDSQMVRYVWHIANHLVAHA